MREILFRGKRMDNGKWVYGFFVNLPLVHIRRTDALITSDKTGYSYTVDIATVGQYTGLKDKNGERIFEGDIVKAHYRNTAKADFVEQVVFHNGCFTALWIMAGGGKMLAPLADGVPHLPQDKSPYMEWCEVIGNIHDNPELLKGGATDG